MSRKEREGEELQELKETQLEEIIEQKVEEKAQSLEEENRKLRQKIQKLEANSNSLAAKTQNAPKEMSRRKFLKKAGLGTVGLAALSLSPTSALDIKSSSLTFSSSNAQYLDIDTSNNEVTISNADLVPKQGLRLPTQASADNNNLWIDEANGKIEVKVNGTIHTLFSTGIEASGGTTTTETTISGVDYRIHAFETTGTSTFSVNNASSDATIDVLIVAGGGAGGSNTSQNYGGGGGAGGIIYQPGIDISAQDYTITVGAGGSQILSEGIGENGGDSEAFGLTALGGGGGNASGASGNPGQDGGSGGGGGYDSAGGTGLQPSSTDGGFGRDGGAGYNDLNTAGGGGGAGQEGLSRSDGDEIPGGGEGLYYGDKFTDSFGENGYFGGGGAGCSRESLSSYPEGGLGGGGNSAAYDNSDTSLYTAGTDGTGAGGGGGSNRVSGQPGGNGIILVRYRMSG